MARHLIEAQLNSRSARRALRAGIYWRRIDATTHLGYRNGAQGGGLPHQGGPLDKVELRRTWSPWWADRSGA